jgi:hypothetical protein
MTIITRNQLNWTRTEAIRTSLIVFIGVFERSQGSNMYLKIEIRNINHNAKLAKVLHICHIFQRKVSKFIKDP